ncbi:hypothetical protein XELAEV_18003351mg [Xenopus laevis]|nr:hypothetical protein XELAEV_18003351mg [Xenopus laevis]
MHTSMYSVCTGDRCYGFISSPPAAVVSTPPTNTLILITKRLSLLTCTLKGSPVILRGLSAPVGKGPSWIMIILTPVLSCK